MKNVFVFVLALVFLSCKKLVPVEKNVPYTEWYKTENFPYAERGCQILWIGENANLYFYSQTYKDGKCVNFTPLTIKYAQ